MIVGFSAAAREDNLLGTAANKGGNLFAGGFDSGAGTLTWRVDGGRVAEFPGEIGKHRVEHRRLDGRRGVVVQVHAVHRLSLRIDASFVRGKARGRDRRSPLDADAPAFLTLGIGNGVGKLAKKTIMTISVQMTIIVWGHL